MTREDIEKAAIKSADEELDDFECRGHRDGFIAGAQWMADRLCIIPWDKALKELHDYWMEKEGEKDNEN